LIGDCTCGTIPFPLYKEFLASGKVVDKLFVGRGLGQIHCVQTFFLIKMLKKISTQLE
jgi:hypothetical protein